jgi:hypothetical protein
MVANGTCDPSAASDNAFSTRARISPGVVTATGIQRQMSESKPTSVNPAI